MRTEGGKMKQFMFALVLSVAFLVAAASGWAAAAENVARFITAEDGIIGRVNAWVLSIRSSAAR